MHPLSVGDIYGGRAVMRTRFAPSPSGFLHMGHAFSAMRAHDWAQAQGGAFHLRIEDIDTGRSREEYVEAILCDLRWLELEWQGAPVFQSERLERYEAAAQRLKDMGLLYPCTCTRAEIAAASPKNGPEGYIYPGTCRGRQVDLSRPHSWRLDMAAARKRAGLLTSGSLTWRDRTKGKVTARPEAFGDVILVRKDAPASYHLAATLDDAADGMTHIVRGMDLFAATDIHRLLQALLDLPVPQYCHHDLLLGPDGRKFSKSDGAPSLRDLRLSGVSGAAIRHVLRRGLFGAGIFPDSP